MDVLSEVYADVPLCVAFVLPLSKNNEPPSELTDWLLGTITVISPQVVLSSLLTISLEASPVADVFAALVALIVTVSVVTSVPIEEWLIVPLLYENLLLPLPIIDVETPSLGRL